ncbi:hypothetical protein HCG49_16765 [Arenibacter sp. 6A1]|uniref:hypothetical protein n=1 Tax=Arenibacter sp. 6A1 TaxID=2720391 RepID=UPI0014470230|nr:hypothetical protein [Arenibacter sp. 6A1]NKI28207.1 hypothetical protein [Arenibacter sp. 6A1]
MEIESIWNILEGFTPEDVYQGYVITSDRFKVVGIGTSLGIIVSLFLLFKRSGEIILSALGFESGQFSSRPNYKKILEIFRPTFYILFVIVAYPLVLEQIEALLANLQTALGGELSPESNLKNLWRAEAEDYQEKMKTTFAWEIGKKAVIVVNYFLIMLIKPFFILLEQDTFSLFMMLRYLYLIILELFGGVALALYLDKETRSHTFTWFKHMLFNYSMVGVFGIANFFSDTTIDIFVGNNSVYAYNLVVMTFGLVVKLFLFKQSFNLLKSNIF